MMNIKPGLLSLKVIPNAKAERLVEEQGNWKLYLQAAPVKGQANLGIIKYFKKNYGLNVRIEKGERSRKKVIMVLPSKLCEVV